MNVKIIYNNLSFSTDSDNAIFTGVAKIEEKDDGMGWSSSVAYSLYSEEGLLYSVCKILVKEIIVLV